MRLYMEETSYESRKAHSTALVLLNTRNNAGYKSVTEMTKPNSDMPWGNNFAFLNVSIPKLNKQKSSNPLEFIYKAHKLIKRKRNSAAVYLTGRLLEALRKFRGPEVCKNIFICMIYIWSISSIRVADLLFIFKTSISFTQLMTGK